MAKQRILHWGLQELGFLWQSTVFSYQLRAILRASHYGKIQIMFPMISSAWELKQAVNQLELAKEELREEKFL